MALTALITGASSGLGLEFARYHASRGGDVIVTARRADALESLKAELEETHGITAHVLPQDLGAPGGADALYEASKAARLSPDILINNAGFGGHGHHIDRALADEHSMIDLNIKALVTLSHRIGSDMAARGSGRILNVGSTAGFMPGPDQAVYFATKAFVNSFSQALDHELRPKGVTVSVLAPGYVETGFAEAANLDGTALTKSGASAAAVARFGYDRMMAGKLVSVNDPKLGFVMNWLIPLMPRRRLLKMVADMQAK